MLVRLVQSPGFSLSPKTTSRTAVEPDDRYQPADDLSPQQQLQGLGLPLFRRNFIPIPFMDNHQELGVEDAAERMGHEKEIVVELEGEKVLVPDREALDLFCAIEGKPHQELTDLGRRYLQFHRSGCRFEKYDNAYQAYLDRFREEEEPKMTFEGLRLRTPSEAAVWLGQLESAEPERRTMALARLLWMDEPSLNVADRLKSLTLADSPLGHRHDPKTARQLAEAISKWNLEGAEALTEPVGKSTFTQRLTAALATGSTETGRWLLKKGMAIHPTTGQAADELKTAAQYLTKNVSGGVWEEFANTLQGREGALEVLAALSGFHSNRAVSVANSLLVGLKDLTWKENLEVYRDLGCLSGNLRNYYSVKEAFYGSFRAMVMRGNEPQVAVEALKTLGDHLDRNGRSEKEASQAPWDLAALCRSPEAVQFYLKLIEKKFHSGPARRLIERLQRPLAGTTLSERFEAFEKVGLFKSGLPFTDYKGLDACNEILLAKLEQGQAVSEIKADFDRLRGQLDNEDPDTVHQVFDALAQHPELVGFTLEMKANGFHASRLPHYLKLVETRKGAEAFEALGLLKAPNEELKKYDIKTQIFQLYLEEKDTERTLFRFENPKSPWLGSDSRHEAYTRLIARNYTPEQARLALEGFHEGADAHRCAQVLAGIKQAIPNSEIRLTAARVCELVAGGHTGPIDYDQLASSGPNPRQELVERVQRKQVTGAVEFLREPLFLTDSERRWDFFATMLEKGYSLEKAREYSNARHRPQVLELFAETGLLDGQAPLNK